MGYVFISYAHEDRLRVEPLVSFLETQGISVWWDDKIHPTTKWRQVITNKLDQAACVLVVWSLYSVESDFVLDEAQTGLDRGTLLSVCLDRVRIPLGFGQDQAVNLSGQDPLLLNRERARLIQEIQRRIEHQRLLIAPSRSNSSGRWQYVFWMVVAFVVGWIGIRACGGDNNPTKANPAVPVAAESSVTAPLSETDGSAGSSMAITSQLAPTPIPPENLEASITGAAQLPVDLSGHIAFVSDRNGNPDIYLMSADGTNVNQLTGDKQTESFPSLSPNGERIVFFRTPRSIFASGALFVMDVDGQNQRQISGDLSTDTMATWSPDGRVIAFANISPPSIQGITVDATTQFTLSEVSAVWTDPVAWSPDGAHLTYVHSLNWDINIVGITDHENRRLTKFGMPVDYPAWSPDGKRIAFMVINSIYLVDADGANLERLTDSCFSGTSCKGLTWSPDGRYIAVGRQSISQQEDDDWEIYVVDVETGFAANLTNNTTDEQWPSWSW